MQNCHKEMKTEVNSEGLKILLVGNPNVGKSVIFSKLTGLNVIASNYSGTTVSYTKGQINFDGKKGTIIDVPGAYSLETSSPAEEVAVKILDEENADVIICVLDATNLERNLNFALQIQKYSVPIIFALNLADVAEHQGITIDVSKLEEELRAPVIKTVAIRNIGLRKLLNKAYDVFDAEEDKNNIDVDLPKNEDDRWKKAGEISRSVQKLEHRHPTFMEKLGDAMLKPLIGMPIALVVGIIMIAVVVGGGKGIRAGVLLPLLNNYYVPFITSIVSMFVTEGLIYNILVGDFGVLILGIEWPFALVLPYVFFFYIALSFLEDSGYLPRFGVLIDTVLRKIGMQGGSAIPIMMGYGCAVPAILGTRAATTKKERIIIATVVSVAVPCTAQTGAFIALLGAHSAWMLATVFLFSFVGILLSGLFVNKILPGKAEPMLLEIPNLLVPDRKTVFKKIMMRTRSFILEGATPMILGVLFAAFIVETNALKHVAIYIEPIIVDWLGLPREATIGLILGVIRRELAVLPLIEMNLTSLQLLVGSVVALFYLPCLAVMGVLIKEFRPKIALLIGGSTFVVAFVVGGLLNHTVRIVSELF
ncbi:MAG: FeoB small GTPase domain-containing protein [Alkaliphilus sp.]